MRVSESWQRDLLDDLASAGVPSPVAAAVARRESHGWVRGSVRYYPGYRAVYADFDSFTPRPHLRRGVRLDKPGDWQEVL